MPLEGPDGQAFLKPGLMPLRPRLIEPIEWRAVDERTIESLDPRSGEWSKGPAWRGDVLDGLAAGEAYVSLVARFAKRHPQETHTIFADELIRRYLLALHDSGRLDLGLPPAPTRFADRYRVERLLGRGGFGVAWLARDDRSGARVVVKHPWNYYHALDLGAASIRTEVLVSSKLDHRGVPRVLDAFEEGGLPHLAREFVEGKPLSREATRTTTSEVVADALAIASIVEHLHARGFLALDLGPSNFFRAAEDGRVVMIDVGSSVAHAEGAAKLDHVMGNRGYVSPEVRRTRVATFRSDAWSVGRLVFAFSTRVAPKDKWALADIMERLKDERLRPVVERLAADDPAERPATMGEAIALLRAA